MSEESTKHLQFSLKAVSPQGFVHLIVWRDDRGEEESGPSAIERIIFGMQVMEKKLQEAGYRPDGSYISAPPAPRRYNGNGSPQQSAPRSNQMSGYESHEGVAIGTVTLIEVKREKETGVRLGFHIDNRSKPVYALGTTMENFETYVRPLFDDGVFDDSFTWESLKDTKRSYDSEDFGLIKAVSGKAKFWDILRVFRPEE